MIAAGDIVIHIRDISRRPWIVDRIGNQPHPEAGVIVTLRSPGRTPGTVTWATVWMAQIDHDYELLED